MCHAEEVVIRDHREVHERVHVRLHLRVRRGVEDPERGEVPHCRVWMIEVGLDPDRGIAFFETVIEHLLPEPEILLHGLVAAGAGRLCLLDLPEPLVVAGADVRPAPFDELPAQVIVDRQALALGHGLGDPETEPADILPDGLVCLGVHAFRIGVLDAEDIPPAILLHVGIVQRSRPGVPDVERAGGVRGKPHDNALLRPFELGEHSLALVLL